MDEPLRNIRLEKLIEREKELKCLYSIEDLLIDDHCQLEGIFQNLVTEVPRGWQYPTVCECRLVFDDKVYMTEDFRLTEYLQSSDIIVGDNIAGRIEVVYTQLIRLHKGSAFLPEENKLLNTIAGLIGMTVFRRKLKSTLDYINGRDKENQLIDDNMILNPDSGLHWQWRYDMAKKIAKHTNLDRFKIKGLYLIGSTKNATAGPCSDIDLLVHCSDDDKLNNELKCWMEGWGYCLLEINNMKTGYQNEESLIDLHLVTDEDIRKKNSFATMIHSLSDTAHLLKLKD